MATLLLLFGHSGDYTLWVLMYQTHLFSNLK